MNGQIALTNGYDLTCYDCDGGDCPETDPEYEETDDCCSPGDFNCDYSINVLDIVSIVDCILNDTDCPCGDLNGDGSVNSIGYCSTGEYELRE
jgi:hypothetical protein